MYGGLSERSPRSRFSCLFIGFYFRLGVGFGLRLSLNCRANFYGNIGRNRTRMRLFLRNAETGQKVNNGFRFDLQLAGQFVNSDLIDICHALLGTRFFLVFGTFFSVGSRGLSR